MSVEAAQRFLGRGFAPVPLGERSKKPALSSWETFSTTIEDAPKHFERGNIGLLLGPPSGGLIDVDLDCDEAIALGPVFLPDTDMAHGRSGEITHYWFRCDAPTGDPVRYLAPDGTTLVELRGRAGLQTMVPPSIHPEGEPLAWRKEGEPAIVTATDLRQAVAKIAGAALLARHWPRNGSRHAASLALEGALLRARWAPQDARHFIQAAAHAAGDEEWKDRASDPDATKAKLDAGDKIPGVPRLKELFDTKTVAKLCEWLGLDSSNRPGPQPNVLGEKVSQVQKLLELVIFDLFHSDGIAYVEMSSCAVPVRNAPFRDYLVGEFYRSEHKAPSEKSVRDAIATIEARARTEGEERSVFLRCAGQDGARYVDLADSTARAIKIDVAGWEIVRPPPLAFVRPSGLRSLPEPQDGGSLDEFRALINVGDDQQWALTLAWLLFVLVGDGPYPILCVHGEQGSAKSTFTKSIRALVDPHAAALRTLPDNLRDLAVAAGGSYVLAFDNVSVVKQEISDALCQMATGGSFATRKLYTDAEEQIFTAKRPVILNGIEEVGRRSDLLERSILMSLPTIPQEDRFTEEDFREAWAQAYPRIFGALLRAAAATLAALPNVRPARLLRMADFYRFACAAETALGLPGGIIAAALEENAAKTHAVALEQSPIYSALGFVLDAGPFEGTASQLLEKLNHAANRKFLEKPITWPKDASRLSGMLNRMAPDLRAIGIAMEFPARKAGERKITIKRRAA
jgi:hypothetical protein